MKKWKCLTLALGAALLIAAAASADTIEKTFPARETVRLNTVNGDCRVTIWDKDEISVVITARVRPDDAWEPFFSELSRSIKMDEEHYGSSSGRIEWSLRVPPGTEVRFNSASGDFSANGLKADIDVETASGDIELTDCNGELDCSTASGDIDIENVSGFLHLSTASGNIKGVNISGYLEFSVASGDIDLEAVRVDEPGAFKSASGDVIVSLTSSPTADLEITSASGDAILDCNGNELKGTVEMWARYRNGDIESDIDLGEVQRVRRHQDRYIMQTKELGQKTPLTVISTASGTAVLNE